MKKLRSLKKVAFAVSGGADSMYMTMQMLPECIKQGVDVAILIVDHGLRVDSAKEALWVKSYIENKYLTSLSEKSNAEFSMKILPLKFIKKPSSNIQEIARNMRYDVLIQHCNANNIKHLFLAHNLDDQAETIFMRIARGSGIDGACGIFDTVIRDGVSLHRPMLQVPRQTIEEELKLHGWEWVEDPSNLNDQYQRVKVRKFLKGYDDYNQLIERFDLFAKNLRRAQSFIDHAVQNEFTNCVQIEPLEYIKLDLLKFRALHRELQYGILTRVIKHINYNPKKQRLHSLSQLIDKICNVSRETSNDPQGLDLFTGATLGGCEFIIKNNILYVFRELNKITKPLLNIRDGFKYFDNRFRILESDLGEKYKIGCLGFDGYCWLKHQIPLPKLINNRILQGLPTVFDASSNNIIAVYMLYGNWQEHFEKVNLQC